MRPSSLRSWPWVAQALVVGDRDAVDPFRGQHPLGGALPVDAWNAEFVAGADVLGHFRHGRRLETQIHLELGGAGEVLDDGERLQAARGGVHALDQASREPVAVEVALEALLDVGTEDLDRDDAALALLDHDGLVDLRDRGRRDGRAEFDEMVLELAAKGRLYGAARFRHAEGRHAVLQVAQVAGQLGADDVGARGQELAELDVARTRGRPARPRCASPWACRR